MAQNKIKINDTVIWQPDEDMAWDFETTYTEDSVRPQSGSAILTSMFTVELFGYNASDVPASEVTKMLQMIIGKNFNLYCYSPYYGKWRTDKFYVGKGSLSLGTLKENGEKYESVSFNMIGINPIVK